MIVHRDRPGQVPDAERRLAIDAEINALLESYREQAKGIEAMKITYSVPSQSVSVEVDPKEALEFNDEIRERIKTTFLDMISSIRKRVREVPEAIKG